MAYTNIKTEIDGKIYTNILREITGDILNEVLKKMVDSLGKGYRYMGILEPDGSRPSGDENMFMIATEAGYYTALANDVPSGITICSFSESSIQVETILNLDDIFSGNHSWGGSNTFNGVTQFQNEVDVSFENVYDLEDGETLSGKLASLVTAIATKISKVTGAEEDNLATFDDNGNVKDSGVSLADIDEKIDERAKKEGISEKLVSGSARGILSPSAIEELFLFQRTANGAGGTGAAVFQSIKGNSIVWNQLYDPARFNTTYSSLNIATSEVTPNGIHLTGVGDGTSRYLNLNYYSNTNEVHLTQGHKYYIADKGAPSSFQLIIIYSASRSVQNNEEIISWTAATPETSVLRYTTSINGAYDVTLKPQIIDLTSLGLENLTIAQLKAYYPQLFYGYNPGAIKNNCATGMVTKDADDNILDTLALPITTATGKLNGEGESVVITPNGMAGVGTSFDEGIVEKGMWTKTIKRRARVDLGTLEWSAGSVAGLFLAQISGQKVATTGIKPNDICSKYVVGATIAYSTDAADKTIYQGNSNNHIYFKDTAFSGYTPEQVATALAGEELEYELATPQLYVLDTPVPVVARVDEDGTQTILPQGVDEQGTPMTAPFKASIQYPVKLGIAPIGQQSLVNLLERMKSAGKIASYTMVWDAATGVYDFTIS